MMDNENWKDTSDLNDWLESLELPDAEDPAALQIPEVPENEISEVPQPETSEDPVLDLDLDSIIKETMSEDWSMTEITEDTIADPNQDLFPVEDDQDSEENEEDPLPPAPIYSDEEPEEEPDDTDGVPRKVRPKRKGGYGLFGIPHLLSTAIWLAIIVMIGVSLGRLVWLCAADVMAFGREERIVEVTIDEDDTLDDIIEKLHDKGLIRYPGLFRLYAQLAKVEEKDKIAVGTFELNTLFDYHALVDGMSGAAPAKETVDVLIPEGYTCAQIFALLEERGVCTVKELEDYCMESQFSSYWFLEDVEKGTPYCLEGFLFPDTYSFYTNSTAQQVFIKLLAGFGNHFTEDMKIQLESLNARLAAKYSANGLSVAYIESHKLTAKDIVIIASMIEKETAHTGESGSIASVIYNRLTNPYNFPKLNIDATLVYALGGKTDLTSEDKTFDSPYNTYLYEGLPPGPISNPGALSLRAALAPTETVYYFYALDRSGEISGHRFFETYEEHLDFISKWG